MRHSFEEKLDRAYQHLQQLQLEPRRWIQTRPYTITDEIDPNTGDNVIYGKLLGLPPPIIPQLIGDCLFNLRSCLDHLAYALAIANKRSPLTDTEAMSTAFPVFLHPGGFQSRGKGRVRLLSQRAQTVIERFQPYYAGDPPSHWLWLLDKLNNIDKHRRLVITLLHPFGASTRIPEGARQLFMQWSEEFALAERKTEIARYRCVTINGSHRVKMEFNPTFVVIFGDAPGDERIVTTTLASIFDYIKRVVIPKLRPLL
jgi:hypothetical protein